MNHPCSGDNPRSTKTVRTISVIFIFGLSLVTFHPVAKAVWGTHRTAASVLLRHGRSDALREVNAPLGGEEVRPREVQAMINLLRTNNAASFRLSTGIDKNALLRQRLCEGAYPIRHSPAARFLILLDGEPVPPDFKTVSREEGVVLAYRP